MNALDLLIVAALGLAIVSGYHRGVLLQLLAYGGLIGGLLGGALLAPRLAPLAGSPLGQAGIAVGCLIGGAALGEGVGWIGGSALRSRARRTRFSAVDAAGGSVVSIVAVLLVVWIVGLNLANGPLPLVARQVRESTVVRVLGASLPAPPSIISEASRFLDRFGFPQVFSGLPPAPAGPVRGPSQAEARSAFEAAQASTVQVLGESCARIQEGSGFVVAPSYALTNAHVVAGVSSPQVRRQGGRLIPATVVHFDPELDVAMLHLAEQIGPPLPFSGAGAERGDRGAILGHPGGGVLQGQAAAVRRRVEAVGPDIYGSGRVTRNVLELQVRIRPGNSGGPFVLVDGLAAGMVFAASTAYEDVGYALAASHLIPIVEGVVGLTDAVPTGRCVR